MCSQGCSGAPASAPESAQCGGINRKSALRSTCWGTRESPRSTPISQSTLGSTSQITSRDFPVGTPGHGRCYCKATGPERRNHLSDSQESKKRFCDLFVKKLKSVFLSSTSRFRVSLGGHKVTSWSLFDSFCRKRQKSHFVSFGSDGLIFCFWACSCPPLPQL